MCNHSDREIHPPSLIQRGGFNRRLLTLGLMLRKSTALFLLRAYPSGEMGMFTLPHQMV